MEEDQKPNWPKDGDSIFKPSEYPHYEARFHVTFENLRLYAEGYYKCAESLINSLDFETTFGPDINEKVYSILFLYHHYIELTLKEIILLGRKMHREDGFFPPHHKILTLWETVKPLILRVNAGADPKPVQIVERIIGEFASISIDGEGYRFPFDKDRNPLLGGIKNINLESLGMTMMAVEGFLGAVRSQFSEYLSNQLKQERP